MKKTRLLIADDHAVVRNGIRLVLRKSPEYAIVAEAEDGEMAVEYAQRYKPDVVIMDISMPKLNGMEATAIIKGQNPDIKIVILTVHETEEYVYEILRAGADGYVLKSAGKKEILAALRTAMSGEKFLSPGITNILVDGFSKRPREQDPDPKQVFAQPLNKLTKRETEVLRYIANGNTNRQIAEILFLSVRTVNTHRTNLMQKLGMHDTAALVRFAIETGLVTLKK